MQHAKVHPRQLVHSADQVADFGDGQLALGLIKEARAILQHADQGYRGHKRVKRLMELALSLLVREAEQGTGDQGCGEYRGVECGVFPL